MLTASLSCDLLFGKHIYFLRLCSQTKRTAPVKQVQSLIFNGVPFSFSLYNAGRAAHSQRL